ncbi:MAG: O-antigen ligase family protein [Solirubrobacterales bacterium]|nr:O-antigen ligase family protein [Solirubrobacterales bacterium]MBV9714933.1 O-antigen ligase family protein [Solirubrobacterales bacterium]
MRAGLLRAARVVLLGGPFALAFFSGGYFDEARAWAGLAAWLLVAVGVLASRDPWPRGRGSWLSLASLALLGAWTLFSIAWAPIAGGAYHAGQLVVLYAGGLLAAAVLLRSPGALSAVEPALAGGALVVIGYGLSGRLLPGLVHLSHSISAEGRLEQPLTYWNAIGELAALGFILAARVGGDSRRPRYLRALAAAACVPLGLGLYLSFSRGALFAWAAGLLALIVATRSAETLRTGALAVGVSALVALAASPLNGFTSLAGSPGTRETQGAIMLAVLAAGMTAAALVQWRLARAPPRSPLALPRWAPQIALAAICAGLALAIAAGAKETSSRPLSAGASRYVTLESNRYDYWRVAMRAFADEPLRGVGAGGWAVWWLRYRTIPEFAQDAHSLPLQTLAELGLIGLGLLLGFAAGIALTATSAHRASPQLAAGPIAGVVVYAAHAPLDWDWQMPAVTLVAIVLAGALLALAPASRPANVAAER